MATIILITNIDASAQVCFDLARNVDVHLLSTAKTREKAIAGRTTGLCEEGDQITWEAIHFGVKQKFTVRITKMEPFVYFEDEMVKGAFSFMKHKHFFEVNKSGIKMVDEFTFKAPLGFLGSIAERLFLTRYMRKLLAERNKVIKKLAEGK